MTETRERLQRTYLNSSSGLSADERRYLSYPNQMLVPCKLEQEKDSFTLVFDNSGLREFESVIKLDIADRYRALANAAELEKLREEYAFSLDPRNLLLDANLNSRVIERDVRISNIAFIDQYKALIACILLPSYSYEDFLMGGKDLFGKKESLKKIRSMESIDEIKAELMELSAMDREDKAANYVQIKKSRNSFYRLIIPIMAAASVIAIGLSVYLFFFVFPVNNAIVNATELYIRHDYPGVKDALGKVSLDQMPYEIKYMLAEACIRTSGLTSDQRQHNIDMLTIQTDELVFDYWIVLGRLDFEAAEDIANRLGDNQLLIYALAERLLWVKNDTAMSGSDKASLVASLTDRIKKLTDERDAKSKEAENLFGGVDNPDAGTDGDSGNPDDGTADGGGTEPGDDGTGESLTA